MPEREKSRELSFLPQNLEPQTQNGSPAQVTMKHEAPLLWFLCASPASSLHTHTGSHAPPKLHRNAREAPRGLHGREMCQTGVNAAMQPGTPPTPHRRGLALLRGRTSAAVGSRGGSEGTGSMMGRVRGGRTPGRAVEARKLVVFAQMVTGAVFGHNAHRILCKCACDVSFSGPHGARILALPHGHVCVCMCMLRAWMRVRARVCVIEQRRAPCPCWAVSCGRRVAWCSL